MRMIRKILLTEYIGAILVAVLVADGLTALIAATVAQISYDAQARHNPALAAHHLSMTYSLLDAVIKAAIYLIVAYLIARWLYSTETPKSA